MILLLAIVFAVAVVSGATAAMGWCTWRRGAHDGRVVAGGGVATAGTLLGTVLGERILLGLPPSRFRRIIGGVVLAVGLTILVGVAW